MNATSLARLLLALAYPFLAHAASLRHDPVLAAIALGDVAVIVMLDPLLRLRPWAWGAMALVAAALAWFATTPYALLPLMVMPSIIVALVAWTFGRTLRAGHVPLITRIMSAIDRIHPRDVAPELLAYTRRLTVVWAVVLTLLSLVDFALALCAVPGGLLDSMGIVPPIAISREAWSWFANGLNYGLVGGLFVGEYFYRVRRFPGRYTSFIDFLRKMAGLGPAFWRGAIHDTPVDG
ncbi:ketosynthase [Lysobacter sp. KIS68-7]|uniref:ketosynthase n=1 Tax=Lysobacter sp. KIS68-7 TaxID=2904252 RepID=UPI001E28F1D0|nr:ketosynthase [Lysobacter sp. KIS68-7]UHQ20360.1 ketosynthase [Lysobacter sp. KIS68-7]